MKLVAKIIVYSSIAFISLCILISIVVHTTNFEFKDGGDTFDSVLIFGIPLALISTLFSLAYTQKDSVINGIQIALTLLASIAFFVVYGLMVATDWCSYSHPKILYIKKNDDNKVIAERDFGCGAVDSTPATESLWMIEEYPFGLMYATRVDTTAIDLTQWKKVENDRK